MKESRPVHNVNVDNVIIAQENTQQAKANGTLWTKGGTVTRILLHVMLPKLIHVDHSKRTSEENARTSEADVDEPIFGEGMKIRQQKMDTNVHRQHDRRQTKHITKNGSKMNEMKAADVFARRKQKWNAARKMSTWRAIMTPQRNVEQFINRSCEGNATQVAEDYCRFQLFLSLVVGGCRLKSPVCGSLSQEYYR